MEGTETYHDTQGPDSLPVGLNVTDEADVVIDVVLSEGGRERRLLTLISRPLLHHAETQNLIRLRFPQNRGLEQG